MNPLLAPMLGEVGRQLEEARAWELLARMGSALIIGALLAARPWRLLLRQALPRLEMIQAQILLCSASAVIISVIGDSVAKAFSLVCLGGFVRFKAGLKDPRDAGVLYVVIGLGMACGHGNLTLAFVGTGFVGALLLGMDALTGRGAAHRRRIRLSAVSEDPASAEAALRAALAGKNVLVRGCALDFDLRRVELDLEERQPGEVASALAAARVPPVRELRWTDLPPA